jgi:hypothetical protein
MELTPPTYPVAVFATKAEADAYLGTGRMFYSTEEATWYPPQT